MKPPCVVNSFLNENFISISVELNLTEAFIPQNGRYTYRLRKDDQILESIENSNSNCCEFKLAEYGQYFVHVSCRYQNVSYWQSSKLIFYFPSFPKEYQEFLSQKDCCTIPPLSYSRPVYPHQDFVFSCLRKTNCCQNITTFATKNNFHQTAINKSKCESTSTDTHHKTCTLLTTYPVEEWKEGAYAFSGFTRNKEHLLVGYRDISKYKISPNSLNNEIGDYYSIYYDQNCIYFDHDYLGLSKIYYYKKGDDFIASNRYHLLLLILRELGIYPQVNTDRAIADLSNASAFARMNYSRNMVMDNTYALPIDQTFFYRNGIIEFKYTSLHEELTAPEPFSEQRYSELIKKGTDELLDNARVAFEHPDYDTYIVDLSGGIDSRIIYSIISHFPEHHDKIRINSLDLSTSPKDLSIALEINSLYGYQYNDCPNTIIPKSLNDSLRDIISCSLSANQQLAPPRAYSYAERIMKLPGFLGELYSRPHMYTKHKGNKYEDDIGVDEFVKKREYYYTAAISEKGLPYYQKILTEELEAMAGDIPMVKLQNHYLFYMESTHHSTYQGMIFNDIFKWPLVQSKTLFHLNNITAMEFRSNRLAFDILFQLNPAVSSIPYEKTLYSDERMKLQETNPNIGRIIRISEATVSKERQKWEAANARKKERETIKKIPLDEQERIRKENVEFQTTLESSVFSALKKITLFNNGTIGDTIGLDCFSRLFGSKQHPHGNNFLPYFYTKVLSLYYELRIFGYLE